MQSSEVVLGTRRKLQTSSTAEEAEAPAAVAAAAAAASSYSGSGCCDVGGYSDSGSYSDGGCCDVGGYSDSGSYRDSGGPPYAALYEHGWHLFSSPWYAMFISPEVRFPLFADCAEHVMVSTFLHALIAAEHVMVSTVQAGSDLRTRRAAMLLMSASASFASQATATQLGQKGLPAAVTSAHPLGHVATLQPKLPQHMWWRRAGRGARRHHLIRWWLAGRR